MMYDGVFSYDCHLCVFFGRVWVVNKILVRRFVFLLLISKSSWFTTREYNDPDSILDILSDLPKHCQKCLSEHNYLQTVGTARDISKLLAKIGHRYFCLFLGSQLAMFKG